MTAKSGLDVIAGPVRSGKTRELIHVIKKYEYAKNIVGLFLPRNDTRNSLDKLSTRDGESYSYKKIEMPSSLLYRNEYEQYDVLAFDEPHLYKFPDMAFEGLLKLAGLRRVVVAGVDMDYAGNPMSPMDKLLACGDKVTKLRAVCVVCGSKATRSQRLIDGLPAKRDSPIIMVGGDESYEPRCRACHVV